jgi:2'-hydroxyisoflavone reductase
MLLNSPTRRQFIRTAAVAGAAASLPFSPLAMATPRTSRHATGGGKRILILGGTGFLGPAVVDAAKARGHTLTLFNRGRTEKRIGMIDGVEHIYGNRDPNLHAVDGDDSSPKGLEGLKGKQWDAVVDTSGYVRRLVNASAEALATSAKQYVFISSISVYKDTSKVGADETAETATLENDDVEEIGPNYGGLKALCERTAEKHFPGRTANIRPGLIVGPGDPTDRFTYWPVRVKQGGEVLAPGTPLDPIQIIDVRDLAKWIVHVIENNINGEFDAVGPPSGLTMGGLLDACKKASSSDARFTWVDADFLKEQQVAPWSDMPVWIPPRGDTEGFHQRTIARATAAGLTFRPVLDTVRDTLEWWPREVERRSRVTQEMIDQAVKDGKPKPPLTDPTKLRQGIKPEREAEVLAAWHKKVGG